MSRQRRVHQRMVAWKQDMKLYDRLYHDRLHFQNWMETEMMIFGLPPYRGTKYRGYRRWAGKCR